MSKQSKADLRRRVAENIDMIMERVNSTLRGENIEDLEGVLRRLGRDGKLPHWYEQLKKEQTLPNLDGKTIGSVIEMIFVAVLEQYIFSDDPDVEPFKINPARGVDLPNLDLGIKSPSTNYCTSEPFFSAYERLLGNEYDVVVMLTDYQESKRKWHKRLLCRMKKCSICTRQDADSHYSY